jgi:hypothetical protein
MFRFSPMKCVVLIWTLSVMGAAATEPDHGIDHVRGLEAVQESLRSSRNLQSATCIKTSTTLDAADAKLTDQAFTAIGKCTTSPCTITYSKLSNYNAYKNACIAAKGALASYKVTIACSDATVILSGLPLCLVSTRINKGCGPKLYVDEIEFVLDIEDCSETATYVGYADYSTSKPVKKPVKKPVMRRRLGLTAE